MKKILLLILLLSYLPNHAMAPAHPLCEIAQCKQALGFTPQAVEQAFNEAIYNPDTFYDQVTHNIYTVQVPSTLPSYAMKISLALQAVCSDSESLQYLALVLDEESFVEMFKQQDELRGNVSALDIVPESPKELYKKMLQLNSSESLKQKAQNNGKRWSQRCHYDEVKKP